MKISIGNIILVSFWATTLVGCFEKQDAPKTEAPKTSVIAQSVSTLDSAGKCNNGKDGALIYDRSTGSFFDCENDAWVRISLTGEKGDQGNIGAAGPAGPAGLPGATGAQGARGPAGTGAPVGFVIRDGTAVAARFIQFNTGRYSGVTPGQSVLVMYDGGEMLWLNTITGKFDGRPEIVYHAGLDCTGTPYVRPQSDSSPDVLNRIYVGKYDDGRVHTFYKITGFTTGPEVRTLSHRVFNTVGRMGNCENYTDVVGTTYLGAFPILQEMPANSFQDLSRLAPLKVEAE